MRIPTTDPTVPAMSAPNSRRRFTANHSPIQAADRRPKAENHHNQHASTVRNGLRRRTAT